MSSADSGVFATWAATALKVGSAAGSGNDLAVSKWAASRVASTDGVAAGAVVVVEGAVVVDEGEVVVVEGAVIVVEGAVVVVEGAVVVVEGAAVVVEGAVVVVDGSAVVVVEGAVVVVEGCAVVVVAAGSSPGGAVVFAPVPPPRMRTARCPAVS